MKRYLVIIGICLLLFNIALGQNTFRYNSPIRDDTITVKDKKTSSP